MLVRVLNRTPVMRWLRKARAWRDQNFDPQVRQLRATVRLLRRGEIDVLFIADSSATFYAPTDVDQARLPQMLQRELGGDLKVHLLAGAGYHPAVHAELVRILGTLEQRPKVVVQSTAIRTAGGARHIVDHPEYGYQRSLERLRRIRSARHLGSAWDPGLRRGAEDFDAFHAIEVDTRWKQARTIGEFRGKLVGRRGSEEVLERQQMLFDYFHGDTYLPDDPGPQAFRLLAQRLREYGVPVVQYWPPIPVGWARSTSPASSRHTRGPTGNGSSRSGKPSSESSTTSRPTRSAPRRRSSSTATTAPSTGTRRAGPGSPSCWRRASARRSAERRRRSACGPGQDLLEPVGTARELELALGEGT